MAAPLSEGAVHDTSSQVVPAVSVGAEGASGGAAVDVGNVGIVKQETGEIRLEGDFLGMYNGEVILCDDTVATTTVVDGNAVWGWTAGAAGDADNNAGTGQCDRK